jgi:hypothetical protein
MKLDESESTFKNRTKLWWHCLTHFHKFENHYVTNYLIKGDYIDCIRCHTCSMKIDRCIRKMEGRTYDRYGHWDSTYE